MLQILRRTVGGFNQAAAAAAAAAYVFNQMNLGGGKAEFCLVPPTPLYLLFPFRLLSVCLPRRLVALLGYLRREME